MHPLDSRRRPARHDTDADSRPPLICVSGQYKKISCFHAETLRLIHEITTPTRNLRTVTIPPEDSDDDDVLVAVSELDSPSETLLYNPFTKKLVRRMKAKHSSYIFGLSYLSPSLVVSGDHSSQVYVSNVRTGKKVMTLKDTPKYTWRIVCCNESISGGSLKGKQLVFVSGYGGADGYSIRLYDLKSERPNEVLRKFVGHTSYVYGLSYSSNDGLLVSTSSDETLRIWSIRDEQSSSSQSVSLSNWSNSVYYESESQLAFCGVMGGYIEVFDIRKTSQVVRKFQPHDGGESNTDVYDIVPTVPGTYVSVDGSNHSVALWTSKGKKIASAVTDNRNYGVCYVNPRRGEEEVRNTGSVSTPLPPPAAAEPVSEAFLDGEVTVPLALDSASPDVDYRELYLQLREEKKAIESSSIAREQRDSEAIEQLHRDVQHATMQRDEAIEVADVERSQSARRQAETTKRYEDVLKSNDSKVSGLELELLQARGDIKSKRIAAPLTDKDRRTIRGYLLDDEDSDVFREIAHGQFGTVYRWVREEGTGPVALKILYRKADAGQIEETVAGLRRARHPNLSELLFYSLRAPAALVTNLHHETVLELIRTRQLTDFNVKMKIIKEVALGMSHLHACRVMHRDLKWENVMITHPLSHPEWRAVVIDYGLVWVRGTSGGTAQPYEGGTTGYMAPEIFRKGATVGFPADVFAFGIMMYEILMDTDDAYGSEFALDGSAASALAAAGLIRDGLRPDVARLHSSLSDDDKWLSRMAACCWDDDPLKRFSFSQIVHRSRVEEAKKDKKEKP